MADRPISFVAEMVRALLREIEAPGTGKTQTRRVLKPQPTRTKDTTLAMSSVPISQNDWSWPTRPGSVIVSMMPYPPKAYLEAFPIRYAPGDRLWVREAWKSDRAYDDLAPSEMGGDEPLIYMADDEVQRWGGKPDALSRWGRYRQGMHMPRWASRITLHVTDVRVQRVQEIGEADAKAEGVQYMHAGYHDDDEVFLNYLGGPDFGGSRAARESFRTLWDSLNASRGYGWEANPWVAAIFFRPVLGNIDNLPSGAPQP